jgi:PBSX family phage terminase large subunit
MTLAIARREDITPARRFYRPYGAALSLLHCRATEVLLSGPAGTGKSRACLEKLHLCAEKYPGMRALILRKTRESLSESALVTWETKVLPVGHPVLEGAQRRLRQAYHYPNGSEVIVCGLDKPQKVMSTEFDMAYIQEAIEVTENDWEMVTTRLRNGVMPYQQLLADTNPDSPHHWLKRRCDRGQTQMVESRHEDNPTLWKRGVWTPYGADYIAKLDALTGARKPRLRHGKWVQAEGAVYDLWDRNVHLIDWREIPADWRRIRSIDFGYTNPFVCQWWAIDPDTRMYLYREIYRTKRTVAKHAREIRDLSLGENIEATVSDHDAEDRATLHEEGIETQAAHKAISPGIQAVQRRLQKAGDEKPRLFVLRMALTERDELLEKAKKPYCTEQEFDAYVWPKDAEGKAVKEVPVDVDNHGMDALRYAVAYVDQLGGQMHWDAAA